MLTYHTLPFLGPIHIEDRLRMQMTYDSALDAETSKLFVQKAFLRAENRYWMSFLIRQARRIIQNRFLNETLDLIERFARGQVEPRAVTHAEYAIKLSLFNREADSDTVLVLDMIQVSMMRRKHQQLQAGTAVLERLVESGHTTWNQLVSEAQAFLAAVPSIKRAV